MKVGVLLSSVREGAQGPRVGKMITKILEERGGIYQITYY
jgi:hypothetical protein